MARIISFVAVRPFIFPMLLTIIMVPSIVIPYGYNNMMRKIEQNMKEARYVAITNIKDTTKLSPFINSSTMSSAFGSTLNDQELHFAKIHHEAYVLVYPCNELVTNIHMHIKAALIELGLVSIAIMISIFVYVTLVVKATKREAHAYATFKNQMGKTVHDVRGYLACIKGWIELSYKEVAPTSDLSSNLKKMDDCVDDLLALVNSILDLSKLEAGKMELDDKEFDLPELLKDISDLHYPNAMKKGVDVRFKCDGSVMNFTKVMGDQGKLKQILSNLISNAVKFTSKGHIKVRVMAKKPSSEKSNESSKRSTSLRNKSLRFVSKNNQSTTNGVKEAGSIKQDPNCMEFVFEVEDTGPGIPKDKRKSIFDNFVQVRENSAGHIGTGLGLGIAQSLVRLMGGDIEIVDKANGEPGTCFQFNIFLIVPSYDNLRQQMRIEFQDNDLNSPHQKPLKRESTLYDERSSRKPLEGMRFLIAEDHPMIRKLAVASLTRWGAGRIEVCEDGKQALEFVCKTLADIATEGSSSTLPFDYILMDCQMPTMDGMEASRRIREEERKYGVRIPIVALTAHNADEEGRNIVEAGMDCHLTKPLKIDELLEVIRLLGT